MQMARFVRILRKSNQISEERQKQRRLEFLDSFPGRWPYLHRICRGDWNLSQTEIYLQLLELCKEGRRVEGEKRAPRIRL